MDTDLPRYLPRLNQRRLRCYALDPGLAQRFETAPISEVVVRIPWETLHRGPTGEYLEVIDYDPMGRCFYEPVDLDDPRLLALDGLPPSEGTPQFHQQMVYAVAQLTITNFERALGRRTLWSPGPGSDPANPDDDSHHVPRLRIYPHALREANAYYSPAKKALLFGYFPAPENATSDHVPGSMVFTCLSHDIIAHETTHALLDGVHRRLNRATNPDMLAFHEAFADIVALFQHFTFPEILSHQIARSRGSLRDQETLLAQLAGQFGRATGKRGALRDAIGRFDRDSGRWAPHEPDPLEYEQSTEPHQRGSILVAAIFDAFLAIYGARVADLLRLVTGGTGILPAGAIHPDLVNRLGDEASKAANHVLIMCVRALDYCPPVDLTFGEYLRALITADVDLVPNDAHNYRVAFVEAFRRRGIFPRDLRTLSIENLVWRSPRNDPVGPSPELQAILTDLRDFADRQTYTKSRHDLFDQEREGRIRLHARLRRHFRTAAEAATDRAFLGLDHEPGHPFEIHSLHFCRRIGPNGDMLLQAVVQITQVVSLRGSDARFEGGSTVVIDLLTPEIAYCIRKPVTSASRANRQQAFRQELWSNAAGTTYFGVPDLDEQDEPFARLHQ